MTSEEINAAIERLGELEEEKSYLAHDVMRALIGRDFPDLYDSIGTLKDLLRQADPYSHIELPKDADGTPIHVGDEMQWRDGERFSVVAIGDNAVFFDDDEGYEYSTPDCVRHYRNPTVEDVLREFGVEYFPHPETQEKILAKYAAKLRKVMADE